MFKIIKIRVREIAQGMKKYDYKKIMSEGRTNGAGTKELDKKKLVPPLKYFLFLFFIAACLFFIPQKAAAQTSVGDFDAFIAITTTTANFDIVLTDNIFFTTGGFNILSGTINGNGYELNGNGNTAGFKILGSGATTDVLFNGDITFNNFFKSVGSNGTAVQGVGLFVAGSTQTNVSAGTATVTFLNSTVNFTSNRATSGNNGTAAQGGGLFAGGAVSAGAGSGKNNSSSGAATITFTSSTVNFTSNSVTSGTGGTAAQGGGLFAGGAVSAGAYYGANTGAGGTATIIFTSSTVNFTNNSATSGIDNIGSAAQGGGLFAGGAVSAGAYYNGCTNNSSSGTAVITFTGSTINFTNNSAAGTTAQGGGLFAGGAVSAAAGYNLTSCTNNSSSGTTTITFISSIVNFTSNTAALGGGLFAGGAVSAAAGSSGISGSSGTNNSSSGTATIIFTSSTIDFTGNSTTSGGGLFAGGAVSARANLEGSQNNSSGGAVTITFTSSTINFTSNSAAETGNYGMVAQGGGLFAGGAVSAGAGINTGQNNSSSGTTTITFTSSTINFTGNSATSGNNAAAAQGGGLFAGGAVSAKASGYGFNNSSSGTTTITFTGSAINFISDSVTSDSRGTVAQGGGLFAGGAVSAGAYSNYGYLSSDTNISDGGAVIITFTSPIINFTGNSAASGAWGTAAQGGGLFAGGAVSAGAYTNGFNNSSGGETTITFTSSTINFTGNSATSGNNGTAAQGGGLFAGGAVSAGVYSNSCSISSGGAVTITFIGSKINFTGNSATSGNNSTAAQGGGLFAGGSVFSGTYYDNKGYVNNSSGGAAAITFTSSTVNIAGNQVTSGSGDTKAQGGGIFLGGSVSAGAYYDGRNISTDGTAAIDFTGSNISISGNTAGLGGGIFEAGSVAIDSGTASSGNAVMNFTDSTINFIGNTAKDSGGAIYITGNFSADSALATGGVAAMNFSGGEITFEGNQAGRLGGAIYMNDSAVTFNTDGGEVVFRSNTANGAPNDIYMDVNSQLNINGANTVRFEGGILTETSGSGIAINKSGTGTIYLGGDNQVWGDFNISGGDIVMLSNAAYAGKALELKNNGNTLDMNNGTVNTINVAGNFASDTNLRMDVFSDGTNDQIKSVTADLDGNINIFAGVGTYYKNEYDLIITSGTDNLHGVFTSSSIISADDSRLRYELKYEDGIVKLVLAGVHITKFEDLGLSWLTYNQRQTAGAFKKISENPGNWAPILNEMVIRQNNGSDADIAVVKDFLARTSGYFLSNVIRNMAADSPNNEVYDKIRNHAEEHKTNSGLWVQVRGGLESFKKDENSLEDYNDLSLGVMFGFDRFLADKLWNGDLMWGVYGRINKDNVEQGQNKADGNKNGLGLYGGYIKDSWELKAMLLGSYDRFSTERAVMGEIAKADINGVTVSADVEAAIKIWMNDNMNFRPYAGIEAANSMYGGFKESGAGIYNLDTKAGNYLRTSGRVGAGLDYEKGIWIWYANVEGKYLIDGTKSEITSRFVDTGIDFYSRGAEEGRIQIGAGLGGEVRITGNWKGFANAKYYAAERYENLYGNVGVRYMFGKSKSKAGNAAEARRKAEQAKLEQERVKAEEAQRIAEEAKITTEISDEDLTKQKVEAEMRRKRSMLKTYSLTTNFRTNEYFLTDEFKEQIKEISEELKNYDYKRITIEGHTDSTGTKEWNKKLSRQRARSVYDEFVKAGVDKDKMAYEGFAAEMPTDSNKSKEGRAANRRTEIFVE